MSRNSKFSVKLFYSYCHQDSIFKEAMEKTLRLLKQDGLRQWSDRNIIPGQNFDGEIKQNMKTTDIFVFLLSPDFLDSEPCKEEWNYAKELAEGGKKIMIPIIIRECAWQDFDDMNRLLALPQDGKPVKSFQDRDVAWNQVYEGIKTAINHLKTCFTAREEHLAEIKHLDFISQQKQNITLDDLFVFPSLHSEPKSDGRYGYSYETTSQLLEKTHLLIYGDNLSGKTTLCRHVYLTLIKAKQPVLLVDLKSAESRKPSEAIYEEIYTQQYHGDYSLWKGQENTTVILDNLSHSPRSIEHVVLAKENFNNVIVTVSADIYNAYYVRDERLTNFTRLAMGPLSHAKQEQLIRKWAKLSHGDSSISDGKIDQVENNLNAIIINNRVVPRYPFYILSILQSYEGFMPQNFNITAYGHCYYVMILAHLLKSGIQRKDSEINSCINFAGHLAFHIYKNDTDSDISLSDMEFDKFKNNYQQRFLIDNAIINRLQDRSYGIIRDRKFRTPYMYYYFLGKYLADNARDCRNVIENMADKSHVKANSLILIFVIHHSQDNDVIDEILLRTMVALENFEPVTLSANETNIFRDFIENIPRDIISNGSVAEERQEQRRMRDIQDDVDFDDVDFDDVDFEERSDFHRKMNDIYRVLKNNEVLGQILRNKYGILRKDNIKEIIGIVMDAGLRIIRFFLLDKEEINDVAHFVSREDPRLRLEKIRISVQTLIFMWIVMNLEKIASAINKPEIRELVENVVNAQSTPAYDLVGYFALLDSVENFSEKENRHLGSLLAEHRDPFINRIISLKTQHYMNTHQVKEKTAQSVCSKLRIKYRKSLFH